ncbi:MAG: class I SAM-dependent methyltransferase [Chloroflexi bacterium]|nr:class I SAM-dependent methyltransferase [Chloroflexota bacterium]
MNTTTASLIADRATASTRAFLERLLRQPRPFDVRLWDGTVLQGAGKPRFTFVIHSPAAVRRMFRLPIELVIGESFIRGDFDIEGDLFAAFGRMSTLSTTIQSASDLVTLARLYLTLPDDTAANTITRGRARLSGALHSKERDRAAIQYHYDVGNDFYALWLDQRMNYSCAYFRTASEDIDAAQEAKLEHICRKLRMKPGERLLDIGCGWGGLAIYTAQKYGVNALGVTLSKQQHALANERIAAAGLTDRVAVKLLDYRDLNDAQFDKIVSVGMFEHVGRSHLPEYFAHAHRLLKPGGLFLNHGISVVHPHALKPNDSPWTRFLERNIVGSGQFVWHYIFPDGELEPVSEVNLLAEQAGFEVRDVENLREHYALTLRQWVARLEAHRDEAVGLVGDTVYRTWRLYMAGSAVGFETGGINVNQTLLAKPANGAVNLPLTRDDLYART